MIYFIQEAGTLHIKIGFTSGTSKSRRDSLQTGNPHELMVIGIIEGDKKTEKKLHEQFKAHHFSGEWFHPHFDILEYIKANSITEPAPHGPIFAVGNDETTLLVIAEATMIHPLIRVNELSACIFPSRPDRVYHRVEDVIEWHAHELEQSGGKSGDAELLKAAREAMQKFKAGKITFE